MKNEDVKLGVRVKVINDGGEKTERFMRLVGKTGTIVGLCTVVDYPITVMFSEELYFFKQSELEPYDEKKEEDKQLNYIEQIAKMLGVEVGEKFNINDSQMNPYRLEESGLINSINVNCEHAFSSLITGESKLEKIIPYVKPTKVRPDSKYYYINYDGNISMQYNQSETFDYAMYALGNMFDTNKIPQQQIDEIVKKLKGDES